MPEALQQFMNSRDSKEDDLQKPADEIMFEQQSFHSGSLGKEIMNGDNKYIDMLSQQ